MSFGMIVIDSATSSGSGRSLLLGFQSWVESPIEQILLKIVFNVFI